VAADTSDRTHVCAGRAYSGHSPAYWTHNLPVVGSSPTRPTWFLIALRAAPKDPLTGRELRFRKTRKTEVEVQIELCRLLELARAGRQPDSEVTVVELLDEYLPVAGWGRLHAGDQPRLHPPHHQARARGDGSAQGPWAAAGQSLRTPEAMRQPGVRGQAVHRAPSVPDLRPDPSDWRTDWEQATEKLRKAITCGALPISERPAPLRSSCR
jgi:hypothetical protein